MDNKEVKSCRLFKRCGGCQLKESYAEQLEWKQAKAERMLSQFGVCEKIIGMENPYNYRNKVQHGYYSNPQKQIISGIYQSGSGRIVPCDRCMLEDKKSDKIIETLKKLMQSFRIFPFNGNTGNGIVRHVMIRSGFSSGEYLVCIVTAKSMLPSKNNFVKALVKEHPYITSIVQNICDNPVPLTMGDREVVLYGKGYIEDELCGKSFKISAKSFYQVNPVQTEKLYSTAIEIAELTGKERVLDCYCGIGTIGLIASDKCSEVIGVEINSEAIKDARINAKKNDCKNITFIEGDSGKFMEMLESEGEKADVVFTDPPRTGSDKRFLSSLIKLAPKKIVYISCGIESLQRDLKILTKSGYKVKKIQPVDMFPHTTHIENVVLLTR